MILFWNLSILEEDTLCDPEYLVVALYKFYKGVRYSKNIKEKHKPLTRLCAGSSFLLNPEGFFNNKTADIGYRAQYIRLAGRRDFTTYKAYGIRSLDLTLYPDLDLAQLKSNPLLTIANKQIYFKYEELKNGNQL